MYGLRDKSGTAIPLKELNITATVNTFTADCVLEQHYYNDKEVPLEVVYKFPLEAGSTIYHFEATINGKTLVGKVQDKNKAEQTYSDAISAGKGAYLLSKEKEDLFSMSIGNLPPKQSVILKLAYVTELTAQDNYVLFSIASTIFTGKTSDVNVHYAKLNFEALLHMAFPIANIVSPYDQRQIEYQVKNNNRHTASISSNADTFSPENLDFQIILEKPHEPKLFCELSPKGDSRAYALHFFPNTEYTECAAELVFLLDRSGSMMGNSIAMLKQTMFQVLKHLPSTASFNIVGFGTDFSFLFPSSVICNRSYIRLARKHISGLAADMGGTNLHSPLKAIFDKQSKLIENKPGRIIFVLTDGGVDDKRRVIDLVRDNNKHSHVFSFGIGSADRELVTDLASAGKGAYKFISGHSDEEMEKTVLSMLNQAVEPSHETVELTWYNSGTQIKNVQQAPIKLPPLFNRQLYTVYGLLDSSTELSHVVLSVKGKEGKQKYTLLQTSHLDTSSTTALMIHRLAAATLIREIEEQKAVVSQENITKIVELSVKYNIASTYASFVIVEDRVEPVIDTMELVDIEAKNPAPSSMRRNNQHLDHISRIQADIDSVNNIMVQNIDQVLARGERLDMLQDHTSLLHEHSYQFKKSAVSLKRRMMYRTYGKIAIAVAILLLIILIIVLSVTLSK